VKEEKVVEIGNLPSVAYGAESPLWWGNTLLLFIETTAFILLLASYFYIRINYLNWPPPRINLPPYWLHPLPRLMISSTNMIVLLISCIPAVMMHRASLKMNQAGVQFGLALCFVFGVAAILLRFYEFPGLILRYNDNAYGSITWMILGTHLLHLFVMTSEVLIVASYAFTKPMDQKHALDVTLTAIYWYWVAGIWILFYIIIYWFPRWL
jgi:cytochrome c oxidase subunit III